MGKILEGKNAVVTGAGRGIGEAIARALASEGANVLANDLGTGKDGLGKDTNPVDQVVASIKADGGNAIANYESVADFSSAERIIKSCVNSFGSIDILVNVAGVLRDKMVWNMSEDDWDTVINVHLKGTFNCCRHACAFMRQQRKGRIINTSSRVFVGNIGQANYVAAKAGILGLTGTIALEMCRYGVTANTIFPLGATRMVTNPEVLQNLVKRAEADKSIGGMAAEMPPPEQAAPLVVYLASDHAANINGQAFFTGGGEITLWQPASPVKSIFYKGVWPINELCEIIPRTLAKGMANEISMANAAGPSGK